MKVIALYVVLLAAVLWLDGIEYRIQDDGRAQAHLPRCVPCEFEWIPLPGRYDRRGDWYVNDQTGRQLPAR